MKRAWCRRFLELFVMEVRRPDGTRLLMSVDPTGFGECCMAIEIGNDDQDELHSAA